MGDCSESVGLYGNRSTLDRNVSYRSAKVDAHATARMLFDNLARDPEETTGDFEVCEAKNEGFEECEDLLLCGSGVEGDTVFESSSPVDKFGEDVDDETSAWIECNQSCSSWIDDVYEKPYMVARPWTKIKEEALAIAWVKSSTCPIVGNNQTDTSFWKATAKRSKTSESGSYSSGGSTARCQIDINGDPEFDDEVLPVHKSERPPGRDKAKKEAAGTRKGGGSTQTSSGPGSKMDELISEFRSFKELMAEKYSYKKNLSADYARAVDFRIMRLDLNSVPEDEREVYRRMKEEVKKKWTS
ncbi:putative No apical meristem-associated domain-containing protein [Helianthus annuus]|uniref:No apical meristem-associated domain-containing protein n=1 Tax=Helianthus annuus TaxID=4232 RepID=A0A9K3DEV5_HELAN|nr:putative No apical meristem-associated domain-containing protein [Helianthus annuus]KAJ0445947.1 putative No apical meristem-associated domain-containing protein [Helianthus annuus]